MEQHVHIIPSSSIIINIIIIVVVVIIIIILILILILILIIAAAAAATCSMSPVHHPADLRSIICVEQLQDTRRVKGTPTQTSG
jgi:hypothetical protein